MKSPIHFTLFSLYLNFISFNINSYPP